MHLDLFQVSMHFYYPESAESSRLFSLAISLILQSTILVFLWLRVIQVELMK